MKKMLLFAVMCTMAGSLYPAGVLVDRYVRSFEKSAAAKEALQESLQCTICFEACSAHNPNVVKLPCDPQTSMNLHPMCQSCMDQYQKRTCPTCSRIIRTSADAIMERDVKKLVAARAAVDMPAERVVEQPRALRHEPMRRDFPLELVVPIGITLGALASVYACVYEDRPCMESAKTTMWNWLVGTGFAFITGMAMGVDRA